MIFGYGCKCEFVSDHVGWVSEGPRGGSVRACGVLGLWLFTVCHSQIACVQILAPPHVGCVILARCLATLCLRFLLCKTDFVVLGWWQ